ncbi:MAG: hypothetical protein KJ970_07380 [Candidatus Eisenbacteria bacterium]|uniref:Uncharacterized protein n=1 Tax=Eiseniibacteriota bacterium TaxID=2212470 RepID=A0A948RTR6_UNCEI|nr:hypothetical protein [Candidatus Eisenbacteria bacterium]MBU1947616.1 hypothetical protein [Candidatus Eisenbacteria bacterium]MBU2690735.1 hypothetical protein [Candidatus Eisenbacteria bacterium]
MRWFIISIVITALASGAAFAGPNAGARLMVQGNVNGVSTNGFICADIPIPSTCEEMDPSAIPDSETSLYWYLAVVVSPPDNTPNFNTIVFGLGDYITADTYIGYWGPCIAGALEISTDGWPFPGEGTAVSWTPDCVYGYMEPVYYFGVYGYAAGDIPLDVHPIQGGVVVDCSVDPQSDDFFGFGAMGVAGSPGSNPYCPGLEPAPGACCFGPTVCVMLLEEDCLSEGGEWYGGDCEDAPCGPNPTQTTTWGSIKSVYR